MADLANLLGGYGSGSEDEDASMEEAMAGGVERLVLCMQLLLQALRMPRCCLAVLLFFSLCLVPALPVTAAALCVPTNAA